MCAATDALGLTERRTRARQSVNADRLGRGVEWGIALVVTLSIGFDPALTIWRAADSFVPPEFRTVSISASDVALVLLAIYGWWSGRDDSANEPRATIRGIAWCGAILAGCVGLSALAAGVRSLSLMRSGEVMSGMLACLALARRRSLAGRVLVCGAGLIVLQLPQVIMQEVSQTSISLGSSIPGWPPITAASVPGALVVFGPGNERWQRGMGSFLHPNLLGGFLALAIVFTLPWLARGGRYAAVLWPLWAIAWLELVLTFSRVALVASIAGCLLWGIAHFHHAITTRRVTMLASVPLITVTGLAIIMRDLLVPRLDPGAALHSASMTDRWQLVGIGARIVARHPLLGVGAGNFSLAEAHLPNLPMSVQPVHVVPLLVMAEAGVVAGLAWLTLVLSGPIIELRANWHDKRLWCERAAVPVAILIMASLDHYFWTFSPGQALFWVSLGVWAAYSRLPASSPRAPRQP